MEKTAVVQWLLESAEPWTRFRVLVDLLERPSDEPEVIATHSEMVSHAQVQHLINVASTWGERPLKRHNDASHPLYALSTLVDFGLQVGDPGMQAVIDKVSSHQSSDGAFQTLVFIPRTFGGPDKDIWSWIACDAPTLLYALLTFGLNNQPHVTRAAQHLADLPGENGYRCSSATELGRFKGPGKRKDPCPIANVYALKALSLAPELSNSLAAQRAAEMLLRHWEHQKDQKYFLSGIGADFRKLKYPFVWYDILHAVDVLSRFPFVHDDPRFNEMVSAVSVQANEDGRFTASSMYRHWQGWSFADKKVPSPWLTFLALRIHARIGH